MESLKMENVLPPIPTTSQLDFDQPPTPLDTVHGRQGPQTADPLLKCMTAGPATDDPQGCESQHLPSVPEAIRARVTQRLRGAPPASFLTDDEDSASEDDASLRKRRCHHIKSGRLCTRDSHVLHRIKWLHEVVMVSQGKPQCMRILP